MTLSTVLQEVGSVIVDAAKENPVAAIAIGVGTIAAGFGGRWLYKRRQAKKAPNLLAEGLTDLAQQIQARQLNPDLAAGEHPVAAAAATALKTVTK